ncbi:MAG: MATE family efflux transporter [Candidatus Ornithospirochaeta sp.]
MLESTKKQSVDLLSGSEGRVIFRFSVPIIFSYLLQQIYTISDAAICGQTLSVDEIAGVNDVFPILYIFLQFAVGCTAGFSVMTSIASGQGDKCRVRKSFGTEIILGALLSIILTSIAILTLDPLLRFIGLSETNPGVWKAAYQYSMVIFIGISAQFYYNLICSVLRSLGDSETPLIFLLFSTVLNIGLDLLFIIVFHLGVIGAAGATAVAQGVSAIMCLIYAYRKYPFLHLSGKDFRFDLSLYTKHLKQGIPMGLQFSVLAIGIIVMQRALVGFDLGIDGVMMPGNPAQNGFGAANKLNYFLMCPLSALGTAIVSFNAQNLGAGRQDRIRRATVKSLMIGTVMCLFLGSLGMLMTIKGAYQYVFMSPDKISQHSIHYGNIYLYVDLAMYFLLMILYVLRSGVQGVGHAEFTLLAGCAELVARTMICTFLPTFVNGGPIDSSATVGAYIALCFGDPGAWILANATLLYPTIRYLFGVGKKRECSLKTKEL